MIRRLIFGPEEPVDEYLSEHWLNVGQRTGRFDALSKQDRDRNGLGSRVMDGPRRNSLPFGEGLRHSVRAARARVDVDGPDR